MSLFVSYVDKSPGFCPACSTNVIKMDNVYAMSVIFMPYTTMVKEHIYFLVPVAAAGVFYNLTL